MHIIMWQDLGIRTKMCCHIMWEVKGTGMCCFNNRSKRVSIIRHTTTDIAFSDLTSRHCLGFALDDLSSMN